MTACVPNEEPLGLTNDALSIRKAGLYWYFAASIGLGFPWGHPIADYASATSRCYRNQEGIKDYR